MLGSGSAGNSALVATDHGKILVDGGLSARQVVLRLEQCGVTPEQLDGVVLTHEHTDHICGLEVLCHKFDLPIYCNRLTAEALRSSGLVERCRNWRLFATGGEFSICDIQCPNVSRAARRGRSARVRVSRRFRQPRIYYRSRLRDQNDRRTVAPCSNTGGRDQSRRKTSAERHASSVAGETANPVAARAFVEHGCRRRDRGVGTGKIERVVLGHLSRDCNTPALALNTVRASLEKCGRTTSKFIAPPNSKSVHDFESARPSLARFSQRSKTLSFKARCNGCLTDA